MNQGKTPKNDEIVHNIFTFGVCLNVCSWKSVVAAVPGAANGSWTRCFVTLATIAKRTQFCSHRSDFWTPALTCASLFCQECPGWSLWKDAILNILKFHVKSRAQLNLNQLRIYLWVLNLFVEDPRQLCLRVTASFFFTLACSMLEAREMKGENGSSALMVRLGACWFPFPSRPADTFSPSWFYIVSSHFFASCLLICACAPLFFLPPRRHRDHLCGGQQQLQHGYKGRQQHQQATGSPGSLSQYLEQQVRRRSGQKCAEWFFPFTC